MFAHRNGAYDVVTKLAGMVVVKKKHSCHFSSCLKLKHYETKNFYSRGSNRIIYCL